MSKRQPPKEAKRNGKSAGGKPKGDRKTISLPAAMARRQKQSKPYVKGSPYSGDGRVYVRHREYVADIAGSVAFANTSFAINPGLSSMFTWLAPIAAQFESYTFERLRFCYDTQKGSSTNGRIMLAVDFDASDAAPVNKTEMMSNHIKDDSAVWDPEFSIDCDRPDLRKMAIQRYVRSGSAAANQDIKTFDVGNLLVATQGCADTTAIGELYVEYSVWLETPQFSLSVALNSNSARVVSGGTVTRAAPFGDAAVITGGLQVTAAAATLVFNKVGQYLVSAQIFAGTVLTDTAPTLTGTAASAVIFGQNHTTAALTGDSLIRVQVNNIGETVIFDYTASATTVTSTVTRVSPYLFTLN